MTIFKIFTQRTLNLGWDRECYIHYYTWVCGLAIWELSPCSGSSVSAIRGSSAVCLLCLCDPLITSCTQSAVQKSTNQLYKNQPISCTKINQSAVQKSANQLYRNQLNNCTVIDYVSYTKTIYKSTVQLSTNWLNRNQSINWACASNSKQ